MMGPFLAGAGAAQEALVARLTSLKASFAALDAYLGETSDAAEPEATLGRIRSFAASFHKACRDNERAEHQRKKKAEAAARLKEMEKAGGAVGAGGLRRSIRTRPGPRPGPSHYMRRIDASLKRGEVAQMGRLHDNIKDELNSILKAGGIPLVLLSTWLMDSKRAPHWVVVSAVDDQFIYLHDPDPDEDFQSVA